MSMTFQHRTTNKAPYPSSLMILYNGFSAQMYVLQQNFCNMTSKLGSVMCQMENQTESRRIQHHHIRQVRSLLKKEPNLKLYSETLKVYILKWDL